LAGQEFTISVVVNLEANMVEKQKPEYDVVKQAAKLFKEPQSATPTDVRRMASRILNDEKNAPQQNRTVPKPKGRH
jgi:hypothetical protein